MDSWDDDEFEVPTFTKEEEDVKVPASWDDEEEEEEEAPAKAPAGPAKVEGPLKPKHLKKLKAQEAEAKRKQEEAIAKRKAEEMRRQLEEETPEQRKAREKKLAEDADLDAAVDLFSAKVGKDDVVPVGDLEQSIGNLSITRLADYEKVADLVADKMMQGNQRFILDFLKAFIRKVEPGLTADEVKDFVTVLNVIQNDKVAKAKPKGKKKKNAPQGKRGFTTIERDDAFNETNYEYDDYDDFM